MNGKAEMSSNSCTTNTTTTYWNSRNNLVNTLALMIVATNSLLIYIILKSSILRKQRFNLIMISLAVTDLLCGFVIPFNTLRNGRWTLGKFMCQFITSAVVILLTCSIYNFVFVNLDRLLAIKWPMSYKDPSGRKKVKVGIGLCWLLSILSAVPMMLPTTDTRTIENDGSGCKCSFPYKSDEWVWVSSSLSFIIPTFLILTIWLLIAIHFRNLGMNVKDNKYFTRITVVMGTITAAFLICWWPYAILFMKRTFDGLWNVVVLAYFNSLLNPLLYMFINKDVRQSVINLFTCKNILDIERWAEEDSTNEGRFLGRAMSKIGRKMSTFGRSLSVDV